MFFFFLFSAIILEQTDVVSTKSSELSLSNDRSIQKLRHSVSYTSPKTVYAVSQQQQQQEKNQNQNQHYHPQEFDETTTRLRRQYSSIRCRRTSTVDGTKSLAYINDDEYAPFANSNYLHKLTARDIVLRRCGQSEPLSFSETYSER